MDVLVIGIAGGTGSGKTTLMKSLMGQFGDEITVLSHDNYYRAHYDLPYEARCKLNYDEPAAFETELMVRHLEELRQDGRYSARCTILPSITARPGCAPGAQTCDYGGGHPDF